MPTATIRVLMPSGDFLEREVTQADIEGMHAISDLKKLLSAAHPRHLPPSLIKLFQSRSTDAAAVPTCEGEAVQLPSRSTDALPTLYHPSCSTDAAAVEGEAVELQDESCIPWELVLSGEDDADALQNPLMCVCVPPDLRALLEKCERQYGLEFPDNVWPFVGGPENPEKMFEDSVYFHVLEVLAYVSARFVDAFFEQWKYIITELPPHALSKQREDGTMLLRDMVSFCKKTNSFQRDVEDVVIAALRRADLQAETTGSHVLGMLLDLCLREQTQFAPETSHTGVERVALELMIIRLDVVANSLHGDFILNHILEGLLQARLPCDVCKEEARMCEVVTAKLSLKQLCQRSSRGICALTYAERLACIMGRSLQRCTWNRVCQTIKSEMVSKFHDTSVSLRELCGIWQDLRESLMSARNFEPASVKMTYYYSRRVEVVTTSPSALTTHLEGVVKELEHEVWERAAQQRQLWLAAGWRFPGGTPSQQTAQVLSFYSSAPRRG
eukprot:TRINITY_DN27644_c0_g1_i1.p1 TRINITY_DN27644_c0_g1~~TRINITY_DN27644_c0_g1_i1.p1  ORF type:complete len:511 (+),score=77.16 TRINITY_DN27644_c0_g1_i1:39-1535(+)